MSPRAKAQAAPSVPIRCPACGSEIAADGRTLIKRSEELEDLKDLEREYAKLPKLIEKLETALTECKSALEEEKKKNVAVQGRDSGASVRTGAKGSQPGEPAKPKRRREWW